MTGLALLATAEEVIAQMKKNGSGRIHGTQTKVKWWLS
jgi:hypothetical protein